MPFDDGRPRRGARGAVSGIAMGSFGRDGAPGEGDADGRSGWIGLPKRWPSMARAHRAWGEVSPARLGATIVLVVSISTVLAWVATHPKAPVAGVLAIVATVAYLIWTRLQTRANGATHARRAGLDRRAGGDRPWVGDGAPSHAGIDTTDPHESPDADQETRDRASRRPRQVIPRRTGRARPSGRRLAEPGQDRCSPRGARGTPAPRRSSPRRAATGRVAARRRACWWPGRDARLGHGPHARGQPKGAVNGKRRRRWTVR